MGRPSKTALIATSYTSLDFANMTEEVLRHSRTPRLTTYMASAWRVISFFLVVFVLPTVLISLPLYTRYHLYHARHLPMTETDTRALNHAVNSFWCQGQRVTTNGTLNAFLVDGAPKMSPQPRHVALRKNFTLRHDDIEYWGVYLLEGSTFTVSSCARWPGGVMLVVQGEENLRKCFYKEEKLEEELNGGLARSPAKVYTGNTNAEGDDEDEENGGEVFDDEVEDGMSVEEVVDDDADLSIALHPKNAKYNLDEMRATIPKRNGGKKEKKQRKGRKNKKDGNTKRERSQRSRHLERVRRSPTFSFDDNRDITREEKLAFLRRFNDTIDVTTGNSSFSSSEEFLEQCKNTIISIDLSPYSNCRQRLDRPTIESDRWAIKINASDYYYFIFTSDNSIELNDLDFHLDMQRATYDVSSPLDACQNATECVFPLAFAHEEAVVVEIPAKDNLDELHSFEVTTTCQPRVPVYMVFILMVPFIILLFAFQ